MLEVAGDALHFPVVVANGLQAAAALKFLLPGDFGGMGIDLPPPFGGFLEGPPGRGRELFAGRGSFQGGLGGDVGGIVGAHEEAFIRSLALMGMRPLVRSWTIPT